MLRTCPFASLLGQVRARLGPRGYYRRSGNGGPQTCLPAACGMAQGAVHYGPTSSTRPQDPRKGPSLVGRTKASSGTASSGWLTRRRRNQGGVPHKVPVTQAMTTKGARRAPAAQCPPFLFGAKGASAGKSIKQRRPFWCNKTKTSRTAGWRSPWSPRRHHRQGLWQSKTNFSQDMVDRRHWQREREAMNSP